MSALNNAYGKTTTQVQKGDRERWGGKLFFFLNVVRKGLQRMWHLSKKLNEVKVGTTQISGGRGFQTEYSWGRCENSKERSVPLYSGSLNIIQQVLREVDPLICKAHSECVACLCSHGGQVLVFPKQFSVKSHCYGSDHWMNF